ncbi:thioredoxin domain-containing protein [Flavobacterium sp. ZB4R12]|uniref:thioredoxin domain-containing protein n=1 Tax=Flavobacterium sp. ZB4R12 TaxID=3398732 RepID=UPI003AB09472
MQMIENFNFIFQYLGKKKIIIDKSEFEFQMHSHPDYPSILAISDTLSFYNIENGVIQVETSEIDLLPDCFVALLDNEKSNQEFCFIEKKDNAYFYTIDKKAIEISKSELESRWGNVVLLVEKPEIENVIHTNKDKFYWVLPLLCLGLFLLTLLQFQENTQTKFFFVFPTIGLLFSVTALKDLFGTKSELLNNFCKISVSTNCNTVVGSNKWKVFEFINFSDLSIVFFSSQFLGLLIFLFAGGANTYFSIQKILLCGAIPVLLLSLYYQNFVEKKWCPICLVIIVIIMIELGYGVVFQNYIFTISNKSLIIYGFIFLLVTVIWSSLKNLLRQQKDLKEFQIKGIRFMRNYEIFKNTLLTSTKTDYKVIYFGNIILGNVDASLKIIIVSSPFCRHCVDVHAIIEEILEKYQNKVCFDIRFNFNSEQNDDKSKRVHQELVRIYYDKGQYAFIKALHDWFKNKDEDKLNSTGTSQLNELKINEILDEQYNWNQENNILFTPEIIINQYVFPKQYDRKELIYFINDLLEDEDFQ